MRRATSSLDAPRGWRARSFAPFAVVLALLGAGGCGGDEEIEPPTAGQRRIVALSRAGSVVCPADRSVDFSFSEGSLYASLRAALLDTRNFGPMGVVPTRFVFRPSIDRVGPRTLGRADIVVLNNASAPIDDAAFATLRAFVASGGSVLTVGDDVPTMLAKKGECAADPDAEPAAEPTTSETGALASILAGPFGAVSGPFATGYNCSFADPVAGALVLARNEKGPNALVADRSRETAGAGRIVALGDDEVFAGPTVAGCGSGKLAAGNINEILALNVFAYLAGGRQGLD